MPPNQQKQPPKRVTPANGLPLAQYLSISKYIPDIGDFIIEAGWFSTRYGVVSGISPNGMMMTVVFDGLPTLLFTMTDEEQLKASKEISIDRVVASKGGHFSVMKHDAKHNTPVWYI